MLEARVDNLIVIVIIYKHDTNILYSLNLIKISYLHSSNSEIVNMPPFKDGLYLP